MRTTALLLFTAVVSQLDQALRAAHAGRNHSDLVRTLVGGGPRERVRTAQGRLLDVLWKWVINHIEECGERRMRCTCGLCVYGLVEEHAERE